MRGIKLGDLEKGRLTPRWQTTAICLLAAISLGSTTKLLLDAREPDHVVLQAINALNAPDIGDQQAREALAILHRAVQPSLEALVRLSHRHDEVGANARDYLERARLTVR